MRLLEFILVALVAVVASAQLSTVPSCTVRGIGFDHPMISQKYRSNRPAYRLIVRP